LPRALVRPQEIECERLETGEGKEGIERLVQGDIINADRKGNERIDEW
jgi:hypothetical protein